MSARTLVVQAASGNVVHCYVRHGRPFDIGTDVARAARVPGIKSAHLVTAGRSAANWCLVLEPKLAVEQGNAPELHRVMTGVGHRIGFVGVTLRRALTRPQAERGLTADVFDWLKP